MIRDYEPTDMPDLIAIHHANGLPANCFPELEIQDGDKKVPNPLYAVKRTVIQQGTIAMCGVLKITSEVYLLLDHKVGDPEQRWQWLQELSEDLKQRGYAKGLEDLTLWVPPEVEKSFGKRLQDLGYQPSPWKSYTLKL